MSVNNKKDVEIVLNLKILRKIFLSIITSILLLFIFQHLVEIKETNPALFTSLYPCEKLEDGTYYFYNINEYPYEELEDGTFYLKNKNYNFTKCFYRENKLTFKNPLSKKEYTTNNFKYLVVFSPDSTNGFIPNQLEYQKYLDDIKNASSYQNKITQFYLPSLIDHPFYILILAVLIYITNWILNKFKFSFKLKKN